MFSKLTAIKKLLLSRNAAFPPVAESYNWRRPLEDDLEAAFPGWEVRCFGPISNPIFGAVKAFGDLILAVSYNGYGKPGYCWRIFRETVFSKPIVVSEEIGECLSYHDVAEAMIACMNYAERRLSRD